MSEYSAVRTGKLKLKGASGASHKKKKGKRKHGHQARSGEAEPGLIKHGQWKRVKCLEDIGDRALIETCTGGYILAHDNGYFTVGEPREDEDSPDPAEVFTVVRVAETKVALKSGYGRYLGVDTAGELVGRAEAVGSRESWEPVFEESKLALCASTHRFLTVTEDGKLMAISEKARDREMITMRCGGSQHKKRRTEEDEEWSSQDMRSLEYNYVKKFQSFADHQLRVCSESRHSLSAAKEDGKLHEALLDRREKMKADRYCK